MILHGQMLDALIIVTFLALPIMFGKANTWHFAMLMKMSLKMAQNVNRASHLPHFSLKRMASLHTYAVWVIASSHYASLL